MLDLENTDETFKLEANLKKAIKKKEFRIYYQPKLDLVSGKIVGIEALIRWEHPELGLIPPLEFIPVAEETGLILSIGEWVLRTACEQNMAWQKAGLPPMIMAVNLSAFQLYQPDLVKKVQQILEETGLLPEYLELEITESMMMNIQQALPILHNLKKLGVRISLDDFGTGYSSLSYLTEIPIEIIKIDQSFVRTCIIDPKDATIVKTIIAMAHQLNLVVVAEGVETKDQLIFLQQNLCNQIQGYLLSKPVPAEEMVKNFHQIEQIVKKEGMPQEVNRQKWLEEALEQARQELHDTVRLHQGMIFKFIERDGKFIHTVCDGELLYRMNLTPEQVIGRELHDFLPDSVAETKLQYYQKAWQGEENVSYEGKVNDIWYIATLRPIRRGGKVVEVICSGVDITDRKETEERFQKVVEYSPKGIVIHRNGTILYANPSALKIIKEEDYVGKSVFTYIHPDYHEMIQQRASQANVGEELPMVEIKLIRQDGEVIDIQVGSVTIPYDRGSATLALFSDITERKKVEQALEESEKRYRRLVELSPEPIVVHQEGRIQFANPAYIKMLKASSLGELIGKPILDYSPPEYKDLVEQRIRNLNRTGISVTPTEEKAICLDGTVIDVEVTGISFNYDGKPSYLMMLHDLTKRKQEEEALRQSEEKYRLIAENMQDLIAVLDTKGIVQYASPSHEKVLGFSPNEYEGKLGFDLVHPKDVHHLQKQYAHMVSSKTPSYVEFRFKHVNGNWVNIEACGTPVLDEQGEIKHIVVVCRDISKRKKEEELLRKTEKLSVVGQLAAGVAHEIRNPLTSIKGFVQLLQMTVDKPIYTDIILSEIDRLEEIVQGFLSLSKPLPPHKEEIDVKILSQQVVHLFESQAILKNVEIVQESCFGLPPIYCDGNQIKQVFISILQNAVEAMPNGGMIKIQTLLHHSDSIKFRFIDQGHGISEERIEKIGEPFFSTKEKGTGLGLMVSNKIVREHGGTINIESTVNKGTTVEVVLPMKSSLLIKN